eukprot:CAMPEP_0172192932 /NCGR_PEP_ID=MMETSP1050-20130122/24642_1 /TAXON_ID=233186 /ORGANISM="Cryptomonas curvata, Strain CCAP979/52" /LENGTH=124 /DNA_ID=CAMNT_0012868369 /DNA_START=1 /DNA_END=372 /DNA_ORIENTATION=+
MKEASNGAFFVTQVLPGYPAEEAGIQVGDRLLTIDGADVDDSDVRWLRQLTRGTSANLALLRYPRGRFEVTVRCRPPAPGPGDGAGFDAMIDRPAPSLTLPHLTTSPLDHFSIAPFDHDDLAAA